MCLSIQKISYRIQANNVVTCQNLNHVIASLFVLKFSQNVVIYIVVFSLKFWIEKCSNVYYIDALFVIVYTQKTKFVHAKTILHAPLCDDSKNQKCECRWWNEKHFDKNGFHIMPTRLRLIADRFIVFIMSSSVITSHRCHRIWSLYLSHIIIMDARTFLTHQTF
jgi:hypothetical protein